jgi:hypothetical protein
MLPGYRKFVNSPITQTVISELTNDNRSLSSTSGASLPLQHNVPTVGQASEPNIDVQTPPANTDVQTPPANKNVIEPTTSPRVIANTSTNQQETDPQLRIQRTNSEVSSSSSNSANGNIDVGKNYPPVIHKITPAVNSQTTNSDTEKNLPPQSPKEKSRNCC